LYEILDKNYHAALKAILAMKQNYLADSFSMGLVNYSRYLNEEHT
jgi:hypothetical protein